MDNSSLLTIKEFAKMVRLNQSTLRYYDEIGLLYPNSRGENNYRYYAPFQVIVVNFIHVLLNLGVPLDKIKTLAKSREPSDLLSLFSECEKHLDSELQKIQASYSVIHSFQNNIQQGIVAKENTVSVCHLDGMNILFGQPNDWSESKYFYKPFIDFCEHAHQNRVNLNYPIGGYHENMDGFVDAPSRPDYFFSIDPSGKSKREKGDYLVAYTKGYYGQIGDAPENMVKYAKEHDLTFVGPVYTLYLLDEISVEDSSQYLCQLSVKIEPTRGK